jgi:hypothetical protein
MPREQTGSRRPTGQEEEPTCRQQEEPAQEHVHDRGRISSPPTQKQTLRNVRQGAAWNAKGNNTSGKASHKVSTAGTVAIQIETPTTSAPAKPR